MKKPEELANEVKQLIASNKTEKAFELLNKEQLSSLDKELILLRSRYAKIKEDQMLGVMNEQEARQEINKINLALLGLSEKIGQQPPMAFGTGAAPTVRKETFNKWWIIIPVVVIVAAIAGVMLMNSGADKDSTGSTSLNDNTTAPAGEKHVISEDSLLNLFVGYYKFDGNADDAGEQGRNGAVMGNPTPSTDRFGQPEKAFYFSGSSNYIELPGLLDAQDNTYSLSFWVKFNKRDRGTYLFMQYPKGANGTGLNHKFSLSKDRMGFDENPPAEGFAIINLDTSAKIPEGEWTHLVVTRSAAQVTAYINGAFVAAESYNSTFEKDLPADSMGTLIGRKSLRDQKEQFFFQGHLDDLGIADRTLSADEVKAIYYVQKAK